MSLQPLLLCEVLEQEHLALYGPSSELELRATNFVALTLGYEPSWLVHEENILDAGALLERWAGIANLGAPPPAASLTSALNDRISGPLLELKKHLGPHGRQRIETCAMDDPEEILKVNRLLLDEIFAPALQPVNESRLAQIYRVIHDQKTTSAFCISGGGIRSATFGLGVIQGLARRNLLDKFDFISTVSGGGYIGSWLSSWMRRHAEGAAGVSSELARPPQQPLTNEPQPLRHLREYSNYLTPRLGAGSGDTWTVAATYVRNLILNWLILVPLLLAVLMIPRIVASLYFGKHAAPEWFFYAVAFLALSFSMTYLGIRRPWKDDRRQAPPGTADLEFIVWCALPLTLAAVLLATQWARKGSTAVKTPLYAWLFFIVPPLVAGLVYVIRVVRASSSNPMTAEEKKRWWLEKVVREILASVAAGTAAGGLVVFYSKNVFPDPSSAAQTFPWDVRALYVCFAVPLVLSTLFAAATVFVGGASRINDDQDREWWARGAGWILALTMGWSVLSVIVIYGPVALQFAPKAIAAAGGVSGLVALLFGRSSTTAATTGGKGNSRKSQAARVAAPLFIVCILSALSLLATRILQLWLPVQSAPARLDAPTAAGWLHFSLMRVTPLRVELILVLALLAVAFLAAWAVNINWFSMHSMYRNRLIRAYLGASRQTRTPNPFTGFDPQDDPAVHLLRPELLWFTTFRDFPLFVKRLEEARASEDDCFARNLALEVERRDGVLLDETLTNTRRREILFQTLNEILRESDLTEFEDKPLTVSMARRWSLARAFQRERQELKLPFSRLRLNRRILEKHFPTEIYPFDTPLIHRADIRNAHAFAQVARKFDVPADESKGSFSAAIETALPKINHWMTTDSDKPLPYPEVARRRKELTDQFPRAFHPTATGRPLHLINMALNLVAGENLAWQERKAESFTTSPLHSGNMNLGYRSSSEYGGRDGISIGTAVAISGAAASPNMGYHSSPVLTFLLTMFNVRLGWWLGNPGPHGDATFTHDGPDFAIKPMIAEATGNTNDRRGYVYLSDGGHFENLGLYEMVLRRRRYIVVSDAGCDPAYSFDDLGNAIRKIRIDLGVPIEMKEPMYLYPRDKTSDGGKYCAIGTIRYSCIDAGGVDGKLLYLKPAVYMNEPKDVYNYASSSKTFPHESTADQFFTESQFESYRVLGSHAIDQIVFAGARRENTATQNWIPDSIQEFVEDAEKRYLAEKMTDTEQVKIGQGSPVMLTIQKPAHAAEGQPPANFAGKSMREAFIATLSKRGTR